MAYEMVPLHLQSFLSNSTNRISAKHDRVNGLWRLVQ